MNRKWNIFVMSIALAAFPVAPTWAADLGTAFTYQGSLENGSGPVTDTCDFRFGLWDAAAGGSQVGTSPQTVSGVSVTDGVFTTAIDFGEQGINGDARWLAIEVQCTGDVDFVPLDNPPNPRVELKPAPHALSVRGLHTQSGGGESPNLIMGYSGNTIEPGVVGASIGGGGGPFTGMDGRCAGDGTILCDEDTDCAGSGPCVADSSVGRCDDDAALCDETVECVTGVCVPPVSPNLVTADFSTVGGGYGNQAGGESTTSNLSLMVPGSGSGSTIGGGTGNIASGRWSTVSGGDSNTASGTEATVGGGRRNRAFGTDSTIGGGVLNLAFAPSSTVGGGTSNQTNGFCSVVPGGRNNRAQSPFSFAAGQRALAIHQGAFVWADSTSADFASTEADQFHIRASGGVRLAAASGAAPQVQAVQPSTDNPVNLLLNPLGGNVGIGTTTPAQKLDVAGTTQMTGFKLPTGALAGRVLTSDASGVGTWQAASGGGGPWAASGNDIHNTNTGAVGIGTTGPFISEGYVMQTVNAVFPSVRDHLACAAAASGKIYCFGGSVLEGSSLGEITEYDPDNDLLTPKSALPSPRNELSCARGSDNGTEKIYCFGGHDGENNLVFDEIVAYDVAMDSAATVATLATPRWNMTCVAWPASNKVYCFGGRDESGDLISEIVQFDPDDDSVMPAGTLPLGIGRDSMGCAASPITSRIYCFGGQTELDGQVDDILEYDPSNGGIQILNTSLPSEREEIQCATQPVTGTIICFGGNADGPDSNQVIEFGSGGLTVRTISPPIELQGHAAAASSSTGAVYFLAGTKEYRIREYTGAPRATLLQVGDPGNGQGAISGAWGVFSSREFKQDIHSLNPAEYGEILDRIAETDVVRFRYKGDDRRTVHLGVIAEESPREILTADGKAVNLADYSSFLLAGLKAQQMDLQDKGCEIEKLKSQINDLQEIVKALTEQQSGGGQ